MTFHGVARMKTLRSLRNAAAVFAVAVSSSTSAQAQTSFVSFLNGAQEAPTPVVTPATGNGTVLLNAMRNEITIRLRFEGLLAGVTVAHIHNGAVGVGGPVILDILSLIDFSARDRTSGEIFSRVLSVTPTQANVLLAGNGYFNIHTELNKGGEIRGQINVVPEPSTYVLMATGLGGLMLVGRRRRIHAVSREN
jgi:hypothetical protein